MLFGNGDLTGFGAGLVGIIGVILILIGAA